MRCDSSSAGELCLGAFKVHGCGKQQKGLKMKMNSTSKLQAKIAETRADLKRAKPRSQRRVELEIHLKRMLTALLKVEIKQERQAMQQRMT